MSAVLLVNPRSDAAFVALAHEKLRDASTAAELQRALRTDYPKAIVHERLLAAERRATWYVYRDGTWVGSEP